MPRKTKRTEAMFPIALKKMLEIESRAYPKKWQHMQDAKSWNDIAEDYGGVSVDRLVVLSDGETWYFLLARHGDHGGYVLDRAKAPGSPKMDWIAIYRQLMSMGIYIVSGHMRGTTSYSRFKEQQSVFEKELGLKVLLEEEEKYNGEDIHFMMIGLPTE